VQLLAHAAPGSQADEHETRLEHPGMGEHCVAAASALDCVAPGLPPSAEADFEDGSDETDPPHATRTKATMARFIAHSRRKPCAVTPISIRAVCISIVRATLRQTGIDDRANIHSMRPY
jgi:hypothetical protein